MKKNLSAVKIPVVEIEGVKYAKLDSNGNVIVQEVYKGEEDSPVEKGLDVAHLRTKVPELTQELDTLKKSQSEASKLASLLFSMSGVKPDSRTLDAEVNSWAEKVKEALPVFESYKKGEFAHAADIDRVKSEAQSAFDKMMENFKAQTKESMENLKKENQFLTSSLTNSHLQSLFESSQFIAKDTVRSPREMFRLFKDHFDVQIKDGGMTEVKAFVNAGVKNDSTLLYSDSQPGTAAKFEEAIRRIVESDPDAQNIMAGKAGVGGPGHLGGTQTQMQLAQELDAAIKSGDARSEIALINQKYGIGR